MKVIIGAGISGLTLAYYLQKKNIDYLLLEANEKVGGAMKSIHINDVVLEQGPHTFQKTEAVNKLLSDLDFQNQILSTDPSANQRFILKNGKYITLPSNPFSFIFGSFFSWADKWRIWKERKIPISDNVNESIDSFFRRRFGETVADYVINPFVSGIYSGNPKELLIESSFPFIKKMEIEQGSVIKGFMKQPKKKPAPIISIQNGNENLPLKIASHLNNLSLNSKITSIIPLENDKFEIQYNEKSIITDEIIFCIPSYEVANYIKSFAPKQAEALLSIDYATIALVYSAFDSTKINNKFKGFGALHPQNQFANSLGILFHNSIFPNKNPNKYSLFTSFIGGACAPQKVLLSDSEIKNLAIHDISNYLKINEKPLFQHIFKYSKSIPQYNLNHKKATSFLNENPIKNIHFCSNWKDGISVPACIENAIKLSENYVN